MLDSFTILRNTLQRSMSFPRGKGRDTGFTRGCAAAELLVTRSALSAVQVVSLELYSHHLINPSDSLILAEQECFSCWQAAALPRC